MHRYVWIIERGEIPNKYHVHHIDHDKSNNKIENLTLLHASEHTRIHALEYVDKNKEKVRKHLNNIVPLSIKAKRLPENREKQRDATNKLFKESKKIKSYCLICRCEIESTLGFRKKVFCGKKCASSTKIKKDRKNQLQRERRRLLHESVK